MAMPALMFELETPLEECVTALAINMGKLFSNVEERIAVGCRPRLRSGLVAVDVGRACSESWPGRLNGLEPLRHSSSRDRRESGLQDTPSHWTLESEDIRQNRLRNLVNVTVAR